MTIFDGVLILAVLGCLLAIFSLCYFLLRVRIPQAPIYKSQFFKSVTSSFRHLQKTHQILCKEVKTLSILLCTR